MERAHAYAALANELEQWRLKPPAELVTWLGASPFVRCVEIAGETISIIVTVARADASGDKLQIEAVANGASHWTTERLIERIIVEAPLDSRVGL